MAMGLPTSYYVVQWLVPSHFDLHGGMRMGRAMDMELDGRVGGLPDGGSRSRSLHPWISRLFSLVCVASVPFIPRAKHLTDSLPTNQSARSLHHSCFPSCFLCSFRLESSWRESFPLWKAAQSSTSTSTNRQAANGRPCKPPGITSISRQTSDFPSKDRPIDIT